MASPFRYVSFAGVSLSCSTPELEEQINRLLPLSQFRDWDGWNFAQAGTVLGPLPTPSIPKAPPLELGVLHWPNDATRPAWFHAAVTNDILEAINDVYTGPDAPQDLILKDGRTGKIITANMSMLPPRPISQLGIRNDGWIITLTDQRFWWHWRSDSITESPESWTALFDSLKTLLGIATLDVETIDSAYGNPTDKWIGYLRPPATVLDAASASVGQRIVVDLDGTVRSVNWETALEDANAQSEELIVALGGAVSRTEIGKYVPAQVNVAGIDRTTTGPNGETVPKTQEEVLEDLAIEDYGDSTGVEAATSTVFVDFDYEGSSDDSAFDALATAAAIDWYGWRLADLDVAFPGIAPWTPTGFEDFVEWLVKLTDPWIDDDNPHEPLIATRVRRPPFSVFPSTVLPTASGRKSYHVKLVANDTGECGATAWSSRIQELNETGQVVDGDWLGSDATTPLYNLYPTRAEDGTVQVPDPGDIFIAIPDPNKPNCWLGRPKRSEASSCFGCGWLLTVPHITCFKFRMTGGYGACECVPGDSYALSGSGLWVDAVQGWMSTQMKSTCCGCGAVIMELDPEDCTLSTVTLKNFHVSCAGGSGSTIFDLVMRFECTGTTGEGNRFVKFIGYGPDACNDPEAACDNAFYMTVECFDCPDVVCGCCCTDYSPWSWYQINIIGHDSDTLNGSWVWEYDDTEPNTCKWIATCFGVSSIIEYSADSGGVVRLTHGDFIYEIDRASWSCHGDNVMTYVSGGSGGHPGVITLVPIQTLAPEVSSPCDLPDTLDVEVIGSGCPDMEGVYSVTREIPGVGPWVLVDPGGVSVTVECNSFGRFTVAVTMTCDADPTPIAFGADTSGELPDTAEWMPMVLTWTNVPVTGDPSVEGCCAEDSTVTIIVRQ